MRKHFTALALGAILLGHAPVQAGGYGDWRFGMTHDQVKAVGDPARYYSFRNGDLGAGKVPFEGGDALLSFYFTGDHMQRMMLIAYTGDDLKQARGAWRKVLAHLSRVCGAVELPGQKRESAATPDEVMAAWDKEVALLAPGQRHQLGCKPMPASERVWASATRGTGSMVMVAVNYAEP